MFYRILLFSFSFALSNCLLSQSGANDFKIVGEDMYLGSTKLSRDLGIEPIIEIVGQPSRVKKRTTKDKSTRKKTKWIDYFFDESGVKISASAESKQLITIKLSFEYVLKSDPKEKYKGEIWIDDNQININSYESQIQKTFAGCSISNILGLYLITNGRHNFIMSYKYAGKGMKDITFNIKTMAAD